MNFSFVYLNSFYHVPKAITQKGPFLSRIQVISNNTHAYIMLHQKNPRIILKTGDYQKPVVNYILLVDSNYNYIKANFNSNLNNAIEVNLNQGIYYLISDINFRYVQSVQHCYNLSVYSSSAVGIFPEVNKNLEEAFKYGIYSYCKKEISPQSNNGGYLYQSKKSGSEFPFMFALFDNTNGKYDITLTDTPKFKTSRCADYYLEGNKNKADSLVKKIAPGQWDLFVHMPYTLSSIYSFSLKSSATQHSGGPSKKGCASLSGTGPSNAEVNYPNNNSQSQSQSQTNKNQIQNQSAEDISRAVFSQKPEVLDDKGYLRQYIYQTPNGYYIGFENASSRSLKMKLILEGLYEVNNPNYSSVPFVSNQMSRKIFLVKPKPGNSGDISFMFDIA